MSDHISMLTAFMFTSVSEPAFVQRRGHSRSGGCRDFRMIRARWLRRCCSVRVAVLEAGPEPAHALLGGAVGEGVRHHYAARLPLKPVVPDGAGGCQRLLDVTGLQRLVARLGMMRRPRRASTFSLLRARSHFITDTRDCPARRESHPCVDAAFGGVNHDPDFPRLNPTDSSAWFTDTNRHERSGRYGCPKGSDAGC